jgi:uncharacterized protein YdaT
MIYKRKIKKLEKKKRGKVIKYFNAILFAHSNALHGTSHGESFETQRHAQDGIDEMSDEDDDAEEETTGEAMDGAEVAGASEDTHAGARVRVRVRVRCRSRRERMSTNQQKLGWYFPSPRVSFGDSV